MSISDRDEYVALKSPVKRTYSPSPSRLSQDSDDSLRALEVPAFGDLPSRRERGRSYSVSGFDFQHDLLPLSTSLTDPDIVRGDTHEKNMGLINGVLLSSEAAMRSQPYNGNSDCVGGGGADRFWDIFSSSPGVVVANVKSVGASLLVWLLSGLLAWTGASSYAELGAAIPQNGGAQAYLSYAYGPLLSYLFAWTAIIALNPGGNAAISLIFAEYINRLLWRTDSAEVSQAVPNWAIKLTAIAAVIIVTTLCVATRNLGSRSVVFFTSVKEGSLLMEISVTILGLVQLLRGKASTSLQEPLFEDSSRSPSAYSLALYSGLWALDGWSQANFVGGEIREPSKNIPRAIHFSMGIVTVLFLLANVSYFVVLDKDTIGASNTVALDFGHVLIGKWGGTVFALMVAISCFGALISSFITSSHLIYAAGREQYIPSVFGQLHRTRKTPLNAALLQAGLTSGFILIGGGFRTLINFSVVASWFFHFLTVLGLVLLRFKEPMLERPYKTWIITPLTFCGVALFLLCMPIIAAPLEALAVLVFISAGIPVYYLTQTSQARRSLPAWLDSLISRITGRSLAADGWQAVATEGDDTIEMSEGRTRR
ncbi:hypothetical protein AX16_003734 [Volvariella volvacea WC 439]|nr:hypothetical protein AX16_003734 [Volvariella volvacea WC 439]